MRGKEQAAKDGRMPATGGVGLYGYDYDPALRERVINEMEAGAVRMMFQWALGRHQHVSDRLHVEREKYPQ